MSDEGVDLWTRILGVDVITLGTPEQPAPFPEPLVRAHLDLMRVLSKHDPGLFSQFAERVRDPGCSLQVNDVDYLIRFGLFDPVSRNMTFATFLVGRWAISWSPCGCVPSLRDLLT